MNRIIALAVVVAVGSASLAVLAQPRTNVPASLPYEQFRPMGGGQAGEHPGRAAGAAEHPGRADGAGEHPGRPAGAAEHPGRRAVPAARPAPAPVQPVSPPARALASPETPAQTPYPMGGAPYGVAPGGPFGPGYGYPHAGDPWGRYQARKHMMHDVNRYRRYAHPRLRHGRRYPGYGGAPYGMPSPYPGAQRAPMAVPPAEGEAPEASAGQSR